MIKVITAETAIELEKNLNNWLREIKPLEVKLTLDTDGYEYPYTVIVQYTTCEDMKKIYS